MNAYLFRYHSLTQRWNVLVFKMFLQVDIACLYERKNHSNFY